jgi:hypothetical protein
VRPGRVPTRHPALALALAWLLLPVRAAAVPPATIAPEELHPGDRAVVRTVFRGDSVEEFPAEIVGVLSGGRVDGQLIVARALSDRLVRMGVAQGMSGSPVYVDGRLAGALASSWVYEREPLFGVTPIREMLRLLELPEGPDSGPSAGPAGADLPLPAPEATWRGLHWGPDDPPGRVAVPAEPGERGPLAAGSPSPLPVPLACAGLTPAGLEAARARLAPLGLRVVPGGSGTGPGPDASTIRPGSAVAVDLMRGDLQLSAIGTVTWRDGDRVLLFGHPLFQAGGVRLPLSTASIVTVVASDYSSFKLGARGAEVGVVGQDRRAGVTGAIGPRARLMPMTVAVEGLRPTPQRFRFELVEDRSLAPALAAIATLNSLLEAGGTGGNQTLAWTVRLHRSGAEPLTIADVAAGDTPTGDVANGVSGPLGFLFANPFAQLRLDSLEVSVRVLPGRAQWTLRQTRLLDARVRPGGLARVECRLERWRGPVETRVLELRIPEELPDGAYRVWVGGGIELARLDAVRAPARYRPTSLDDAWRRFAGLRRGTTLYAAILAEAASVTTDGRDYPDLPSSADALLASGLTAAEERRRSEGALVGEVALPFAGAVRGELQLNLTVDSKAP